jgi:hypothetical protein
MFIEVNVYICKLPIVSIYIAVVVRDIMWIVMSAVGGAKTKTGPVAFSSHQLYMYCTLDAALEWVALPSILSGDSKPK